MDQTMTIAEKTPTILRKIVSRKWEEIATREKTRPLGELAAQARSCAESRGFIDAIKKQHQLGNPAIIAEIKKASPSKGVIRENFVPADIAVSYENAGAACLSVLTDKDFFQGDDAYLTQARDASQLPVLRKDFMVAPYQIYESKVLGADCILLIAACLELKTMQELESIARELGMDVLVEVHNAEELDAALQLSTPLLGINNRDLHSFDVTLDTTFNLLDRVGDGKIIVTESGIVTPKDVKAMRDKNVETFLVGESFMRADDPGAKLRELFF